MIRHIVFFSAKNADDVGDILAGLRILRDIPHADRIEIEPNLHADALSDSVDVVVYGEFRDLEALEAYKSHPIYRKSIERVRPLREMRLAADIQSPFTG